MRSHSKKIAINTIIAHVSLLRENQAFYQEVHGEEKYRAMIVNRLNKLPGIPAPAVPESVSQEGESSVRRARLRFLAKTTFPFLRRKTSKIWPSSQ
jgi:hypothetical protein